MEQPLQSNSGTEEQRYRVIVEQRNRETLEHWNRGTEEQ